MKIDSKVLLSVFLMWSLVLDTYSGKSPKKDALQGSGSGKNSKQIGSKGSGSGKNSKQIGSKGSGSGKNSKQIGSKGSGSGKDSKRIGSKGSGYGEKLIPAAPQSKVKVAEYGKIFDVKLRKKDQFRNTSSILKWQHEMHEANNNNTAGARYVQDSSQFIIRGQSTSSSSFEASSNTTPTSPIVTTSRSESNRQTQSLTDSISHPLSQSSISSTSSISTVQSPTASTSRSLSQSSISSTSSISTVQSLTDSISSPLSQSSISSVSTTPTAQSPTASIGRSLSQSSISSTSSISTVQSPTASANQSLKPVPAGPKLQTQDLGGAGRGVRVREWKSVDDVYTSRLYPKAVQEKLGAILRKNRDESLMALNLDPIDPVKLDRALKLEERKAKDAQAAKEVKYLTKLERQNENLLNKLQKTVNKLEDSRLDVDVVKSKLVKESQENKRKEEEISKLNSEISQKEKLINSLKGDLKMWNERGDEIEAFEGRIKDAIAEFKSLKSEKEKLEKQIEETKQEAETVKSEKEKLEKQVEETKQEAETVKSEKKELEKQVEETKQEAETVKSAKEEAEKKLSDLEKQKVEIEEKNKKLSVEVEESKDRVESYNEKEEKRKEKENKQKTVEDKASVLLAFFGNANEDKAVNFNDMNIAQQNAVLDNAISLMGQIENAHTLERFIDDVNGLGLASGKIEIARLSDSPSASEVALRKQELLDALKKLRNSPRVDAKLVSIFQTIYDSLWGLNLYGPDGTKYDPKSRALGDQLVAYFRLKGIATDDLPSLYVAMFNARQGIFAILEQLELRKSFIDDDVYEYHKQHISELYDLMSILYGGVENIAEKIKGLTSGHALYVLLISLQDKNLKFREGGVLEKLLGDDRSASNVAEAIRKLLTEAVSTESSLVKKLLNDVVREVREDLGVLLDTYQGKELSKVFNLHEIYENVLYELEHVEAVRLHGREIDTSGFVSSHASVLSIIESGRDVDGRYAQELMNSALDAGDSATILHMISLLDPAVHGEIFDQFNTFGVCDENGKVDPNKRDSFLSHVKSMRDTYFVGDVKFKEFNVEDEIDFSHQHYEWEDPEMARRIKAARTNAQHVTRNTNNEDNN